MTGLHAFPPFRHFPNPLHPAVLHFGLGVEALGDGLMDDGRPPRLVFLDGVLRLGDYAVYGGAIFVKVSDDMALCIYWWKREIKIFHDESV